MRVTEIIPLNKRKSKVLAEGDFAFSLYRDELRRFHIEEGGELPEEVYGRIEELLYERARERALYLLKDRDRTEAEIARRLREDCCPGTVIERVLEFLREYHFVDDDAYGRRYAELYGRSRSAAWISCSLRKKGLSREQAERALEEADVEEEAQVRAFLVRRNYDAETAPPEERRRVLGALLRRGYSYEVISKYLT